MKEPEFDLGKPTSPPKYQSSEGLGGPQGADGVDIGDREGQAGPGSRLDAGREGLGITWGGRARSL